MDKSCCAQVQALVPGKEKKKKKPVKYEMNRLKQAEKKKRRLEKALATSAAIRSELEEKKQKKLEEQLRLDKEGAAIAEAAALHVLCDDPDDLCQIMLNRNDVFGFASLSLQERATNIGVFMGGQKPSVPCLTLGKYPLDGFEYVSDAYGYECTWSDRGIGWNFSPSLVDQAMRDPYFREEVQFEGLPTGIIAAQALSSLRIADDANHSTCACEKSSTVFVNGMVGDGYLRSDANVMRFGCTLK